MNSAPNSEKHELGTGVVVGLVVGGLLTSAENERKRDGRCHGQFAWVLSYHVLTVPLLPRRS